MKKLSLKRILKSKTLLFSLALGILGAIEATDDFLQPLLGDKYFGIFCMFLALCTAVLRFMTTTGLSDENKQ